MPDASHGPPATPQPEWIEDLDVRPGQNEVLSRIRTLEGQLRERPAEWRLRLRLAQAYASDGNFGAAANHLRACHELVTDPAVAAGVFFNLGVCLEHLNRWREAASAFEQCLFLLPDLFWAHYQLGLCRMRLGDWQRAVEDLRRAVALDDGQPEVFSALRDALQEAGMTHEAGEAHYRLLQLRRENPRAGRPGEPLPN